MTSNNIKPKIVISSPTTNKSRDNTVYENAMNILNDTTPLTEEETRIITQSRLGYALVDIRFSSKGDNSNMYVGINMIYLFNAWQLLYIPDQIKKDDRAKLASSEFANHIRTLVMKAILNNALPIGFWRQTVKDVKSYYRSDPNLVIQRYSNPDYYLKFNEENYAFLTREEARTLKRLREEQAKVMKGEIKGLKAKQDIAEISPVYTYSTSSDTITMRDFNESMLRVLGGIR